MPNATVPGSATSGRKYLPDLRVDAGNRGRFRPWPEFLNSFQITIPRQDSASHTTFDEPQKLNVTVARTCRGITGWIMMPSAAAAFCG
jgi:hypothetical protein